MEFQRPVEYLIRERSSIRAYDRRPIEPAKEEALKGFLEKISDEAKSGMRFHYLSLEETGKSEKLGTYGMIAGARNFIVAIADPKTADAVEIGFLFEKIILFATDLSLGTCWLGGTFDRAALDKKLKITEGEFIPVISPVGYAKERRSLAESMVRKSVRADQRLPFAELFFDESADKPLTELGAGSCRIPLEMVRLGPSASNKQPWRVIKSGETLHFWLARTKGYGIVRYDVQLNDIGIAKCHFELTAAEAGLMGSWEELPPESPNPDWTYVTSFRLKVPEAGSTFDRNE
jgi:nitroreductase